MKNYKIVRSDEDIDWNEVRELIITVDMATYPPELHKKAFNNSYTKVFVFDENNRLIAMGRANSDGAYEAALYDIAVHPDVQGAGLGRLVVETLLEDLKGFNVLLFASPGKEGFYESLGLDRLLTGMIRFTKPDVMREKGFIK